MQHTAKDNCRFCGFTLKKIFIDLGKPPLANSYLKYNQIKKPKKSGGSPRGVNAPPILATKKIKNIIICTL